jgi:DNA invertase Pin-like site-specific DNA recombinase
MKEIIAYCRVSTKQQGASGLGMEAQRAAVESYAKGIGARVAGLYVEVESGKKSDRPELARALAHAKRNKAALCVAKLDRLSRNVEFLARVMNAGTDFVACDYPAANRLTLHIMAAVAEAEAKAISDRTRAALQAAKARGTLLGSDRPGHWTGREKARQQGARKGAKVSAEVRSKAAVDAYADLTPLMKQWRTEGLSLHGIAGRLNTEGHTTRRGRPWNAVQVARVLERTGLQD